MKLFIQEYATSGGFSESELTANLLVEGFGMLRTLISYCKTLAIEVSTTLDSRLMFLKKFLHAETIESISSQKDFLEKSRLLASEADAFLVIAPGTGGILKELVTSYEQTGTKSLNCSPLAIALASNKKRMYEVCAKNRILFPKTAVIAANGQIAHVLSSESTKEFFERENFNLSDLGFVFPVIIKPNDGVACEGARIIRTEEELQTTLRERKGSEQLVQAFIEGENLSITAFITNEQTYFLSLNKQILSLGFEKSEYLGGITNFKHPKREEILQFCREVLTKVPGLSGFVGIDLIAKKDSTGAYHYYFIELNARPTTPICAFLDKLTEPFNFLQPESLTHNPTQKGTTYFAKAKFYFPLKTDHPLYITLQTENDIITPPVCFDKRTVYTLVRGSGKNSRKATAHFDKRLAFVANKLKEEFL